MTTNRDGQAARLGVRERTQLAIRSELSAAALSAFAARGFDATTVDDIAASVGVSRRTFFRYFASKEDAILQSVDQTGDAIAARLALRPSGEPALEALRRSLDVIEEEFAADPERWLTLMTLSRETPALRARHLDKQDRWIGQMAEVLAPRMALHPGDTRPRIYCAVTLAAADVELAALGPAITRADIHSALDHAIEAITQLGGR
jgi:AcrR family transcriptional regulator